MERPVKIVKDWKNVLSTAEANSNGGYNQAIDEYEAFLPDGAEILKLINKTQVGTSQPMGVKGEPTPEPKPLFLHDYRVGVREIMFLAKAIAKRLGKD